MPRFRRDCKLFPGFPVLRPIYYLVETRFIGSSDIDEVFGNLVEVLSNWLVLGQARLMESVNFDRFVVRHTQAVTNEHKLALTNDFADFAAGDHMIQLFVLIHGEFVA